ncbi:1-aminocyclopropane-1-carboxylate synthase [Apostasia shenzhenica]|uniref:1-aminocyclopropane-1-carboxylate synthase n=1 Tax=Apostasia shenzhenica TaxID=1088818 RepID=A0A2I0AY09_9ASPA|nr:1-aminocyclopropane-1-carboxylate synthase [Apostasia shenzhenica]
MCGTLNVLRSSSSPRSRPPFPPIIPNSHPSVLHSHFSPPPTLSSSSSSSSSSPLCSLIISLHSPLSLLPMGPPEATEALLSEIATNGGHCENSSYFDGWKAYDQDPYHPTENPDGVIQMGLAENQLCHDLLEGWLRENPAASICTPEGSSQFKFVANFQDYHGLPSFRFAVAKFMEKARGGRVTFDPNRIVMSGGATGAQETLAFCLANPGDAFLIPTPYYPAFDRDFCWRTKARLLPIHCESSNGFKITAAALDDAYESAGKTKARVKGILVTNPSNPLGTTMDRETLQTLFSFVNEKRIHLICDEIFGGTVFKSQPFVSVVEIAAAGEANIDRSLVHVVSSLSKDLGLPGFRVGIIYSFNDAVVATARKMSSFGLVSSQTQHLLGAMLSDEEFTSRYLAENARRLAERHEEFTDGLKRVGIRCLDSNGGLFCWMDLRPMLKEKTPDGELELWRVIVNEVKLNVSPGSAFHCREPGWFRVCFANMDGETTATALRRIRRFVERAREAEEKEVKRKEKKRWDSGLRLSLPRRFDQNFAMAAIISSPHSPLVQATN